MFFSQLDRLALQTGRVASSDFASSLDYESDCAAVTHLSATALAWTYRFQIYIARAVARNIALSIGYEFESNGASQANPISLMDDPVRNTDYPPTEASEGEFCPWVQDFLGLPEDVHFALTQADTQKDADWWATHDDSATPRCWSETLEGTYLDTFQDTWPDTLRSQTPNARIGERSHWTQTSRACSSSRQPEHQHVDSNLDVDIPLTQPSLSLQLSCPRDCNSSTLR